MSLDKWRGAWCGRNAYSAKSTAAPRHLHRASPLRYAAKPFLRRIYPSRDAALWFATPARQTCHAGMADVPRRRGRRAVPAWQTIWPVLRMGIKSAKTVSRLVGSSPRVQPSSAQPRRPHCAPQLHMRRLCCKAAGGQSIGEAHMIPW